MLKKLSLFLLIVAFAASLGMAQDRVRDAQKMQKADGNIESLRSFSEYHEYMQSLRPNEDIDPVVGDTVITTHYDYFGNNQIRDFVDFYSFDNGATITPCMAAMVRYDNSGAGTRVAFALNGDEFGYNPFMVFDTTDATWGKVQGWPMVVIPKSGNLMGTAIIPSHIGGNGWLSMVDYGTSTSTPFTSFRVAGNFPSVAYDATNNVIWYSNTLFELWNSTDEGETFNLIGAVNGDFFQGGGPSEAELYTSADGQHIFTVNAWTFNGNGELEGIPADSSDYVLAYYSNDFGATWEGAKIETDGAPDQINNRADYAPIIENFGQVQGMMDDNGVMHVVANGYSWKWTDKPNNLGYFVFPVVYYNSTIDTWTAVSDAAMEELDLANLRPGNGLGISYPCITGTGDGQNLLMMFQVPEVVGGELNIYTGGADSIWYTDIHAVKSTDGGATWSAPFPIANKPNLSEAYPTVSTRVSVDGTTATAYIMYLEDVVPGTSLFTLNNGTALCDVIYKKFSWDITVVGVDDNPVTPNEFSLEQNFPNPFNPTTQISFSLENSGMVSLKVFDVLGTEVATLVNSNMTAGAHTVNFDASNLASGMYIYKLTAGNFTASKKMMLMK